MAYQTYITEALVCGSDDRNTADRSFLLFTRDAGMLHASAKSVREERSKQRYALQDFSHVRVTLVRGKSGWKVTGAEAIQNFYTTASTRDARTHVRNTTRLLKRIMRGESPQRDVFDDVVHSFTITNTCTCPKLQTILSLRILYMCGYIAPESPYEKFIREPLSQELVAAMTDTDEIECRAVIEQALTESHL